jgi:uncharacterized membrane protein YheB (UPF0754 family)
MSQITLKLNEILTLEAELNGFTNPQTGEKVLEGFLKEKLNLATKYRLTKLSEELKKEKAILDGLRDDLIKEYGTEEEGQTSIKMFEDKKQTKINPKFIEFQSKYTEFLDEEKVIDYTPLTISDLDKIESNENYSVLFKLIQE